MIDDNELRALFQAESDEHLQSLDEGLLRLETHPDDTETLQRVFRDAHSLKGSARMLGIGSVEQVAHRFEDVLGAARRGEVDLTAEVTTRLYETLDTIRTLVGEAVTGVSARVNLAAVLARLDSIEDEAPESGAGATDDRQETVTVAPSAKSEDASIEERVTEGVEQTERTHADRTEPVAAAENPSELPAPTTPPPTATAPAPAESAPAPSPTDAFTVETIRVDSRKLDDLMLHAGELVVTGGRIARRASETATVSDRWTELHRDLVAAKNAIGAGEGSSATGRSHMRAEQAYARVLDLGMELDVLIDDLKRQTDEDRMRLEKVVTRIEEGIRSASLLPLSTVFGLFPRMIRDLAHAQDKELHLEVEGGETTVDKGIIEQLKDPLMHLIRNSADHGIEPPEEREAAGKPRTGTISLRASQSATRVTIDVVDDGRGVDAEVVGRKAVQGGLLTDEDLHTMTDDQIRGLIFAPGFSTSAVITDLSGRGVGLDVVTSGIERLRGTVSVQQPQGGGSLFRIELPVTLATSRVLVVSVSGVQAAFPMDAVSRVRLVSHGDISRIESQGTIDFEGEALPLAPLWRLLELERPADDAAAPDERPCVIVRVDEQAFGVFVDSVVGIQEVLLTTRESFLKRVRNVAGATILPTGEICYVLNPTDLLASVHSGARHGVTLAPAPAEMLSAAKRTILIAEDSITTRTQIARVLESAGYEVVVSVDGTDALQKLAAAEIDALVSDIEMPNLDGIGLTERLRANPEYEDLPIVLLTSLASDEDKMRGVEAGANAYITKSGFDQQVLLDTLERLL